MGKNKRNKKHIYKVGEVVNSVCNGKRKSSGTLNGQPLKWEFVEE